MDCLSSSGPGDAVSLLVAFGTEPLETKAKPLYTSKQWKTLYMFP